MCGGTRISHSCLHQSALQLTSHFRALISLLKTQLSPTGPSLVWLDGHLDAILSLAQSLYGSRQSSLKV